MNVQYVIDNTGKKTAVQLTLKQWNDLQKGMSKLALFDDLKAAFKDMKAHKKENLKTPSTKRLLAQL